MEKGCDTRMWLFVSWFGGQGWPEDGLLSSRHLQAADACQVGLRCLGCTLGGLTGLSVVVGHAQDFADFPAPTFLPVAV